MRFLLTFFCTAALILPAAARAQQDQAQLDALLAPIALYPDDVVQLVLDAATAPAEIAEATQWSRNNRGMTAEDSVRAVQGTAWRPSVKALVAYPELLDRMAESPQWMYDLGNAWIGQQAAVMSTIQALRQRAYASGTLQSDQYQTVEATDQGIAVAPAMPYIYYVPYYDPLVVYGGWWWPAYRPVYWRPWYARPVFVTHVAVVNRGFHNFHSPHVVPHVVAQRGPVSPAVQFQQQQSRQFVARQQAMARPSPAVQMQNQQFRQRMAPSSFHPQFHPPVSSFHPPVHAQAYRAPTQAYRAPMMQGRAPSFSSSHSSFHPPSGGGGRSSGHNGGSRGRS